MFRLILILSVLVFVTSAACASGKPRSKEEFLQLKTNAEAGDATSQYQLGRLYHDGSSWIEEITNPSAGMYWIKKSADHGYAIAQHWLGQFYWKERDYVEAEKWYRKAAEQGAVPAQVKMGEIYKKGLGVKRDDAEAENWFNKAVKGGGAFMIARDYDWWCRYDWGLTCNRAEAEKWYFLAADRGSKEAQWYIIDFLRARGSDKSEIYYWQLVLDKTEKQYPNIAINKESRGDLCPVGRGGCRRPDENEPVLAKAKKDLNDEQAAAVLERVATWRPVGTTALSTDAAIDNFLKSQSGAEAVNKFVLNLDGYGWDDPAEIVLLWKGTESGHQRYYLTVLKDDTGVFEPAGTLELKDQADSIFAAGMGVIGLSQLVNADGSPTKKKRMVYKWRDGKISEGEAKDSDYIRECEEPPNAQKLDRSVLPER